MLKPLCNLLVLTAVTSAVAGSTFTLIQPTPGQPNTVARAVSADGSVVVGDSSDLMFRWTAQGGRADVGAVGRPNTISADGSTFAGRHGFDERMFRWSLSGGLQDLGHMPGYGFTEAVSMNTDGSIIAGNAYNGGGASPPVGPGFRWTAAGGYQSIGTIPGGAARVVVQDMSNDGNTIVGYNDLSALGPLHAFVWTPQTGSTRLIPASNPAVRESVAQAVSGDGRVIGGNIFLATGQTHPFRWTAETGLVDLGVPNGSARGTILYSNFDGTTLICGGSNVYHVWQQGIGYTPLVQYFQQNGISLPAGYTGINVQDLSDDGRTFIGVIDFPGFARGFVATVPAPAVASVMCITLPLALRRRRR